MSKLTETEMCRVNGAKMHESVSRHWVTKHARILADFETGCASEWCAQYKNSVKKFKAILINVMDDAVKADIVYERELRKLLDKPERGRK